MSFSLLALLVGAGCLKSPSPAAPPAPVVTNSQPLQPTTATTSEFVGDAACKPCHVSEHAQHGASSHAKTLHEVTRGDLGKLMPPMGRIAETDIVLSEQQGALQMTIAGEADAPLPLDLAFGSGKTGMTYVALMNGEAMELHKSWFPNRRTWYVTPGHERQKPTDVGMMHTRPVTEQCVLCHAVTLPSSGMKPEPRFFGVGCESCHGAGGAHVAAMQSGHASNTFMENLGKRDAISLNNLCARCHRGAQNVAMQTNMTLMTSRFQPYGLMKSRCFLESGNRLSCLSCHNPHTDASKNLKSYEAVCLSCHAGSTTAATPTSPSKLTDLHDALVLPHSPAKAGKACPVNPATGCIGCHMPQRPIFITSEVPATIADHFIRVPDKKMQPRLQKTQ